MSKGSITLLCGLPGSGKSTWAKFWSAENSSVVVCPDDYRKILTGQDFYGPAEESVWSHVKVTVRVLAQIQEQHVLVDATLLTEGARAQWVRIASEIRVPIHCIVIDTPLEVCEERNASRKRRVPEDVMDRMADSFVKPTEEEGFASISVLGASDAEHSKEPFRRLHSSD